MATSPFVPEDERQNYVTPEFLKKTAPIDPLVWLPKLQARKFRLDQQLFDTNTPTPVKEKLRAAIPAAATTVMLYKNIEEFKTEFQDGKNLRWIQQQLESIPTEGK